MAVYYNYKVKTPEELWVCLHIHIFKHTYILTKQSFELLPLFQLSVHEIFMSQKYYENFIKLEGAPHCT